MRKTCWLLLLSLLAATPLLAQAPVQLEDEDLQSGIRKLSTEKDRGMQVRQAGDIATRHRLSSAQVKKIAQQLPDDRARFDFASAAYPRTVDPENFYEVYDSFQTFSYVIRLHDFVKQGSPATAPVPIVQRQPVSDADFNGILQTLRNESFEKSKLRVARSILTTSRANFLSSQVAKMVNSFDFDQTKLELAKFAFDYTLDPHNFHVVQNCFSFSNHKEELAKYVESHGPPRGNPKSTW